MPTSGRSAVVWTHSKYKTRFYKGSYELVIIKASNERQRTFVLTAKLKNGKSHTIQFESHEQAKKLGWKAN